MTHSPGFPQYVYIIFLVSCTIHAHLSMTCLHLLLGHDYSLTCLGLWIIGVKQVMHETALLILSQYQIVVGWDCITVPPITTRGRASHSNANWINALTALNVKNGCRAGPSYIIHLTHLHVRYLHMFKVAIKRLQANMPLKFPFISQVLIWVICPLDTSCESINGNISGKKRRMTGCLLN